MSKTLNIIEPANYEEPSKSDTWRAAMYEEIESINRNHTWDLVELPEGKTPIGCKCLYKPKINADGSIEKLKARLVAKCYSQQEGIDFDDTFAPVAKLNTIRMLISLATKHKWQLHQLDVKSAFLNGDLKEEIYLVQPEGFVKKGQEHLVCFSDSDWEGNLDDRRSITGYTFNIGSGVIAWSSKKHSTVALSSCEAKYQALCVATCEAIRLRRLLNNAGEEQKESTTIKTDNQSIIKLAYNPVFHKNTKHINTQIHFVQEKLQSKEICVEYCKTCDNMADIFTKPLGRVKFELFRGMLGIQDNPFLH
eukprot:PITA_15845